MVGLLSRRDDDDSCGFNVCDLAVLEGETEILDMMAYADQDLPRIEKVVVVLVIEVVLHPVLLFEDKLYSKAKLLGLGIVRELSQQSLGAISEASAGSAKNDEAPLPPKGITRQPSMSARPSERPLPTCLVLLRLQKKVPGMLSNSLLMPDTNDLVLGKTMQLDDRSIAWRPLPYSPAYCASIARRDAGSVSAPALHVMMASDNLDTTSVMVAAAMSSKPMRDCRSASSKPAARNLEDEDGGALSEASLVFSLRVLRPGLVTLAAATVGLGVAYGAFRVGGVLWRVKGYRDSAKAAAKLGPDGFIIAGTSSSRPLKWFVIDDQVMGGRSSSAITISSTGSIEFGGVINTTGGGFSSCRTLGDDEPLGFPAGAKAIEVTVTGDARQYKLTLHTADSWAMTVPSWQHDFRAEGGRQTFTLPLKDFKASKQGKVVADAVLEPSRITGVGINLSLYDMLGKPNKHFGDGPFKVELHSLSVIE
ncbi:unnamed protein product [Polarella glacialis]|uniref:NADH:ubiquinone oxidoreductase intermediate-associated protein 30 domain-containing protein n=1 Tax=Polarella glacialis TaxID=89957 RepID=A0A813FZX8_POLGL|nr:unnamed protein product [Polarella glacialis]